MYRKVISILIVLAVVVLAHSSHAQTDSTKKTCNFKYNNYFDLAASYGDNQLVGALGWSHLHKFGKKKRFHIGYGVRYSGYWGGNKLYTTAPSKYTSTRQDPLTILSDDVPANIDTISIISPQVNSFNAVLHIQYAILPKLELGTNIDLVGFSFGGTVPSSIISSVFDDGQKPVQDVSPTKLNLLLTSDNDIGSLNSEFYVRYWLHKKWAIRAGYTFYFSEYSTKQKLSFDNGRIQNDRYRLKSGLFMLGITFSPFNK